MDVRAEIHYPTATVERVFTLVTDPAFRSAVCEATGALSHDVDVDARADATVSVTVRRTMSADVPEFAKKFVGQSVDVVQTEHWGPPDGNGQRTAQLVVQIAGKPAKMTGSVATHTVGAGAKTTLRGDLKVSIPFVGKQLEPEIAKAILAAVDKEQQTADKWLGEPA